MHGLIVGSPEKKRADPAVLRGLCSHTLPNGKNEVRRPAGWGASRGRRRASHGRAGRVLGGRLGGRRQAAVPPGSPAPCTPDSRASRTPRSRQVLVHEFESWASVQADRALQFDWDDALGNAARREAGLRLERLRQVSGGGATRQCTPAAAPASGTRLPALLPAVGRHPLLRPARTRAPCAAALRPTPGPCNPPSPCRPPCPCPTGRDQAAAGRGQGRQEERARGAHARQERVVVREVKRALRGERS